MASLPSNIGVSYTVPTTAQSISAFVVGNLFCNFLVIVGLIWWISKLLGILWIPGALLVAYYIAITLSKAHKTGSPGLLWFRPYVSYIARNCLGYFDTQYIFEGGFEQDKRYIIACHPHGIHGFGTMVFMDEDSPFYQKFPFFRGKLIGLVAWIMFFVPALREIFLAVQSRDVSREVATAALQEGKSLYFLVGGEAESLLSEPGVDKVVARRDGFVRLALHNNALLVPMYTFHNTDTYQAKTILYGLRKWISKRFQLCFPIWWGRGFTPLPFNVQLTVAVGQPVTPDKIEFTKEGKLTKATVDAYLEKYLTALEKLYETHKTKAGYPEARKLEITSS